MAKWQKGQSGNPKGRKKGAQSQSTAIRKQLQTHSEELVQKVVELALEGDLTAIKLCLERVCPPLRQRDESYLLYRADSETITDKGHAVISDMLSGNISSREANSALSALHTQAKIIEIDELERRLSKIEDCIKHDT